MISTVTAVTILTVAAVAVAVWGSYVGIMSAERGPDWARHHLRRAVRILAIGAVAGAVVAALVEPAWFGLAITYVALVSLWIAWRVRRTTEAAESLGETEPLGADRVALMLRRASQTLMVAGLVLIAIAVADFVWRSWPALVDFALAAALLVPAYVYRRRADRLSLQASST